MRKPVPVVIGHYWRRPFKDKPQAQHRLCRTSTVPICSRAPPATTGWAAWGNVYCVDFSVGGRYAQRAGDEPTHYCSLAAVRVPEWQVMHDDGSTWEIGAPGTAA